MGRPTTMLSLMFVVLAPALPQLARAESLPVQVRYQNAVVVGQKRPCIEVSAAEPMRHVRVTVTREGKQHAFSLPLLEGGSEKSLCWDEPPGYYAYRVAVSSTDHGAERRRELTIELSYLPPIRIDLAADQVDVERGELTFKLNHPAVRAECRVVSRDGSDLANVQTDYPAPTPGTPLKLSWGPHKDPVGRITLRVHGKGGNWTEVQVVPWLIVIPHEEVNFSTASYTIPAAETGKLDNAIKEIQRALHKQGTTFKVNLYVAGFTDTVGTTEHNRTLSDNRARAIAAYFRRNGVRLTTFYRGYGEEALAVGTRDNTDEARNRRAVYVLSGQPPVLSKQVQWGNWRRAQ